MSSLVRWSWAVTVWNVLVILWGAFVRATGSGAGCGAHWPLCNGEVVPRSASAETLIELTHRTTSGIALVAVVALVIAVFRARTKGHPSRRAAAVSLGLILFEAALGAGLVLFGLVAENSSLTRASVMGLHLVSTFLLLGSLALTSFWLGTDAPLRVRERTRFASWIAVALLGMIFVGATGAISALGDTLFPSGTLAEGLRADISPTAHVLIRLRVLHPLFAVALALLLLGLPKMGERRLHTGPVRRMGATVGLLALAQLLLGAANVALLAPVTLQLAHLLLADTLWIALVLYGAHALSAPEPVADAAPSRLGTSTVARAEGSAP